MPDSETDTTEKISPQAKPSEAKPSEAKPTEAKPTEAKPTEAKPSEATLADVCPLSDELLAECQSRIGYEFSDLQFLVSALTHASGADSRLVSNERMEFLGDAILGWVVCEELYHRFPDFLEGDLTKLKSVVVSRRTCAKVSRALGLQQFLILGKGMTTSPNVPMSVLADVFESLVAGIYLDGGQEVAAEFIKRFMEPQIEEAAASESGGNYKSMLQQLAQREHGVTPTYHLQEERGPDHCKCFKVSANIGSQPFPAAWGRSKKESEQRAAHNAINSLKGEPAPFSEDDFPGNGVAHDSAPHGQTPG